MPTKSAHLAAAVALCALAVPFAFASPAAAAAKEQPHPNVLPPATVGLYPSTVSFDHVLRGGRYVETIGILNGTAHPEWFRFALTGRTAPWLKILPANQAGAPMTKIWADNGPRPTTAVLRLDVPATLADGTYTGVVTVSMKPPATKKNGPSSVALGGQINVKTVVTGTEVVGGRLLDVYTYPKVEQGEPLKVFAIVKDTGNVAARPSFHFQVVKTGAAHPVFDWVGTTGEAVLPGQRATYELDWPSSSTQGATLGKYTAKILSVTFPEGKDVGSWTTPFHLYPFGALHRGGKLLSLKLLNKPRVGYSAEVQASVSSNGEVQQDTYFVGQLYRNGSLLEGVKSPVPVLLAPAGQAGSTGVIQVPVPITKGGLYRLTGVANFAGAATSPRAVTFRVGSAPLPLAYELAAAGVVVVAALVALLLVRGRRGRRSPPPRRAPHTPPRYTATHIRALNVPARQPVGSSQRGGANRSRHG